VRATSVDSILDPISPGKRAKRESAGLLELVAGFDGRLAFPVSPPC
jgi:hypothetical protein